jgi:large-conductance mechanosensitive channel
MKLFSRTKGPQYQRLRTSDNDNDNDNNDSFRAAADDNDDDDKLTPNKDSVALLRRKKSYERRERLRRLQFLTSSDIRSLRVRNDEIQVNPVNGAAPTILEYSWHEFRGAGLFELIIAVVVSDAFSDIGTNSNGLFSPLTLFFSYCTTATSFINDIFLPVFGFFFDNNVQNIYVMLRPPTNSTFYYPTVEQAQAAGAVTWNVGRFARYTIIYCAVSVTLFLTLKALLRSRRAIDIALIQAENLMRIDQRTEYGDTGDDDNYGYAGLDDNEYMLDVGAGQSRCRFCYGVVDIVS